MMTMKQWNKFWDHFHPDPGCFFAFNTAMELALTRAMKLATFDKSLELQYRKPLQASSTRISGGRWRG